MDTQRWERAGDIFEKLLSAPHEQRAVLLETLCGDDAEIRDVVASMLNSENSAAAFEQAFPLRRIPRSGDTTSEVEPPPADSRVGPWRLVRELGRGGMGVVWLAERADGQFEQRVALKLIKRGMDSDAVIKRFLRERQILARLDHPHIAHLLDGGITADGRPYFAMEYVEGLPLLRYCHDHAATLERRLRLFLDTCEALQYAHANLVVHRDLKPSNVMVTPSGTVKLLDFGIAKLLDTGDGTIETITHRERPMTPAYAAPEQISGGKISEGTDVYALGCVLYELLTGQRARDVDRAIDIHQIQHIAETTDPIAPSRLHLAEAPVPLRQLRGDLDTIVLKALKRDPARRYASVAAFAADIKSHLGGQPIAARRDHALYRAWKFVRRHRVGVAASLAIAALVGFAALREFQGRTLTPVAPGAAMAIVDFNNLAQDKEHAWLAPALAEMLGTQLAVGSTLHAAPDELVRPARADLPAPLAGGYAATSLATLRKRLGVDYVVSGSYLVSGNGGEASVRIDLALQDARDARAVANSVQTGALADLPALVDKAGAELRAKLGIKAISETVKREVDQAQPPNTEVARHMGLALDALHKSDAANAKDELLEAVALAPGYAPAYLYLAQAWKALGYDTKALAAAQQAAANSDGLASEQRLLINREVAAQKADWIRAIDFDRQLLEREPASIEHHLRLIGDLNNGGQAAAADAALAALRKLPGTDREARIELIAARIDGARGDHEAQITHAEAALHLASAQDEQVLVARARQTLADAHDQLGQHDVAEGLVREAIAGYRKTANPHGEADATLLHAIILGELGDVSAERDQYQRSLEIYQRIGDQRGVAATYSNLVRVLWDHGDRDAAETAGRNALNIMRETGDLRGEAWNQETLAILRMDEAADDDVIQKLREAIALDERIGNRTQRLIAMGSYAEVFRRRGALDEAKSICAQARAESAQQQDPYSSMMTEFQCGLTDIARGDLSAGSVALTAAQDVATRLGDAIFSGLIATELARIDLAQQRLEDARVRLRAATAKLNEVEAVGAEAKAQSLLALVCQALNAASDRDLARARARDLRGRITTRNDALVTDIALAALRGEIADPKQAATALEELANDAEKRQWLQDALEARLAALNLLDRARDTAAGPLRQGIEKTAREHGFGWVLARLSASASAG